MAEPNYQQSVDNMIQLTEDYVRKLTAVWTQIFEKNTCCDNLNRLYDHAKNFYDDLVTESLQKKLFFEEKIEELRSEREDLQRLLKTEVTLPHVADDQIPLLVVQREMDKSLSDLREQLRQRRDQICYLLLEQETLCEELGEPTRPLLDDPLPTAGELDDFRSYLDDLKEERVKRMQKLMELRREIKHDLKILEVSVNTEADDRLLNHRQIKLSRETFDSLNKMREYFSEQVDELKMRIDNIRQKLPALWERLNTPFEERRKIEQKIEYNQTSYDYLYSEFQRCEERKRLNLKGYIQKIRLEIDIWWDKTLKSDLERRRFTHYNSQVFTDEMLTLHEMELEDSKQYYEANEEIFQLFANRKILWERMTALEQKACDPARYNNRGGQLLKEEKERKTIATKLPKIEQKIKNLVLEYQEREHAPFLVYGNDILELMEAEWQKKKEDKEAIISARKNAVTPNNYGANRSQASSGTRTPLMQRSGSTMTLCKTPSSTNLSTSKQLNFGSSAQKRKLHPKEKTTPNAKRSLWTSPGGMFLKPTSTISSTTKNSAMSAKLNTRKNAPRVLATTIRRRSGRLSANSSMKKRRSLNKSGRTGVRNAPPQIIVTDPFSTDDENYDVFKQSIEPDSRSSIQHEASLFKSAGNKTSTNMPTRAAKHLRQHQKLSVIDETKQDKIRLGTLPKPQIIRTPSKQSLRDFPISPGAGTSAVLISNRKLTTKNLPILI